MQGVKPDMSNPSSEDLQEGFATLQLKVVSGEAKVQLQPRCLGRELLGGPA